MSRLSKEPCHVNQIGPSESAVRQEPTDLAVNTEYEFCGMRHTEAQCFFVPAASEHPTYETATDPALQVVKCFPPAF